MRHRNLKNIHIATAYQPSPWQYGLPGASKQEKLMASPVRQPEIPYLHLSSLPHVPLLRIMRFLDERSLEKMRRTSRLFNLLIVRNRNGLVWKELENVEIMRIVDIRFKAKYYVTVHRRKCSLSSCPISCQKIYLPTRSLFLQLTTIFSNSHIRMLNLFEIDLDGLSRELTKSKLRIESIDLVSSIFGSDPNQPLRILTIIRPQEVFISQLKNFAHFDSIFSERFFHFISSLRKVSIKADAKLCGSPHIPLPENIQKMPNELYAGSILILPMSFVVRAVRNWYENSEEFGCWWISLRRDLCPDAKCLAEATGLPYTSYLDRSTWSVVFKIKKENQSGQGIEIYEAHEVDGAIFLAIESSD